MSSNMFSKKGRESNGMDISGGVCRSSSDQNHSKPRVRLKSASLNCVDSPPRQKNNACQYRMFVGTWNVGGKTPNKRLNLQDFLQVEESPDIYVLGFQEIVPLTAGNVLVLEDNEPAARWLALIHQALNMPQQPTDGDGGDPSPPPPPPSSSSSTPSESSSSSSNSGARPRRRRGDRDASAASSRSSSSGNLLFHTPSLKVLSNSYRVDSALVKTCNCSSSSSSPRRRAADARDSVYRSNAATDTPPIDDDDAASGGGGGKGMSYCLIASKQMVGLFMSVWVRKEVVEHVGHLRVDCVGRGIMGWLGNKGCIAMSMTLRRTSLCFVCSHLASGEKEGDELRRNADVAEIVKSAHFPRSCRPAASAGRRRVPERILDHDRMIWLGDLNYRVALSYEETRTLLEDNDWDALLEKDQLMIEREAGRVFRGWKEGKICFAPTYKYTHNSDAYAGETAKSKKKRRTPAWYRETAAANRWCDRILWQGDGIEQLQYLRGESRFSDHRPVCGMFAVEVDADDGDGGGGGKIRTGYYSLNARIGGDKPALPQCHQGDES